VTGTSAQGASQYWREPAWSRRAGYQSSVTQWDDLTRQEFRDRWIGAAINDAEVSEETRDGAFVEEINWQVAKLQATGQETTLRLITGITDLVPRTSLRHR